MIKILFDPQIFNEQNFGGISRYYIELFTQLTEISEIDVECPLFYTDNIHFQESPFFSDSFQKKKHILIKLSKILRAFRPKKLKKRNIEKTVELLKAQQFNLFIPTYYDPYFSEYLKNKPFVLTVHDMIHELFPQYFSDHLITIENKRQLINKATKIIAVSNNTKKDILRIYPHIDASKIEVVYLAHSKQPESKIQPDLPEKYVLFVGNRSLYKNFTFFLKAIAPALRRHPNTHLLCAGGNAFTVDELQLIRKLKVSEQVIQQNFRDHELANYYKNALFFVFPSEYEGFGIPVLESMTYGCPVILANHSSFPEVAEDAGVYFEWNNLTDLTSKITLLLEEPEQRRKYSLKGLEQAKKFSWHKTAMESLDVYMQSLSNKNPEHKSI
ncbi:glycosyltransferase family 1 protein [Pedobacter gandavensis]|uniref:glycosyltransferase family 4 protein n=1 Tax=Pedobacter gandavensis TaxID=2679963 RepID=UPI00292D85CE|nr:glycosyltransferase family 1 protein [Pedobacter gandavensis]